MLRPLPVIALGLTLLAAPRAWALDPAVADAVALDDCATVRAKVSEPGDDAGRLALGWCLRHADPERALTVLAPLTDGVLGRYARWLRATTLHAAGRDEAALAALNGLSLPGDAGLQLRLTRARAQLALHRSLDARDDLRELLATDVADEARFLLAEGGRDRGDTEAAIATYERTWTDSVVGPWSDQARAALATLGVTVPDTTTPHGRDRVRARIAALRSAQRHDEALELLLALRAAEGTTAPDADLGRSYFRARRYADAVATWHAVYGPTDRLRAPAVDLFDLALATARTGDYAGADAIYRVLLGQHPDAPQADEASYKPGYMAYDEGRCDDAVRLLQAHLAAHPRSRFADSARWFAGRCQWLTGDRPAALSTWAALVRAAPDSSLAPAVAYWTARAKGLDGDAEGERSALAQVLDRYPVSGHAWLAALALGRTFPARPEASAPAWPAELAGRSEVRAATTLVDAGFGRWAAAELAPVLAAAKRTRQGALAAAWLLERAGSYADGRRLASPYCGRPQDPSADPVAMQACWPRVERRIVDEAAGRFGLNPLLPYAIMLSESVMNPSVTSYAGARGLMQLMPAELPRLHALATGRPGDEADPDDLYLGPYNARIGTTELGAKGQALAGLLTPSDLPAVIASYNGGEAAVRRWIEALPESRRTDDFVEAVGYTQTRRYVRGVLGHLMAYRFIYGDPAP